MSTETIWELDLFEDDEREQLAAWNRTEAESPWGRTLVELFEEQAAARPEAEAVVCGERRVSYGELNRGANRWAQWVGGRGGGRGGWGGGGGGGGVGGGGGLWGGRRGGGGYGGL